MLEAMGMYRLIRYKAIPTTIRTTTRFIKGTLGTPRSMKGAIGWPNATSACESASPYQWHLGRHQRHELYVCLERKIRNVHDGVGDVLEVHARFHHHRPVRLHHAVVHSLRHFRRGISNVDLAARDIVLASVQRKALGDSCDRVLRGRVRYM